MKGPAEKRRYLEQLDSEVNGLHPILLELFPKLPDVEDVDYTHGPSEMGADFVLRKRDSSTGMLRYVGVIAKLGKIQQKETDEVERQLKECFVPRKVDGGKQKILLNEVWVVCTETISTNAQEKFLEDRAFRSVTFLRGEDLIQLLDKHSPDVWESTAGHLGQYLRTLASRLHDLNQSANMLGTRQPTQQLELECSAVDPRDFRKGRKPRTVALLAEIDLKRLIFVEGEPGAGKSHLVRSVATKLTTDAAREAGSRIPVFVTYKDLAAKYSGSLQTYIDAELGLALKTITESSRLVVFVDVTCPQFAKDCPTRCWRCMRSGQGIQLHGGIGMIEEYVVGSLLQTRGRRRSPAGQQCASRSDLRSGIAEAMC